MKNIKFCPKCGKEIDADSTFCTHCGFTLNTHVHTNFWSTLKSNQRIGIIVTGLWLLIHVCFLVSAPLEEDMIDETIWFIDTDFSDFYAYGLGEFLFYGILIPSMIWGFVYIMNLNKKVGFSLLVGFLALLFLSLGICQYNKYAPIINREFCGCDLGDEYSSVLKNLKKSYEQQINENSSNGERIVLSDVSYGSRFYKRIVFSFYNNKLYKVGLIMNCVSEDTKISSYKNFKEIFEDKKYPHDPEKYSKYSNTYYYLDRYTELELRYSVAEYEGSKQEVQLIYYDLNSHEKDEGL